MKVRSVHLGTSSMYQVAHYVITLLRYYVHRHHQLVDGNSGAEKLLSIKNGQFFPPPNIWQMTSFLNPFDALIPKIAFSFFSPIFRSWSPPRPGGQSRYEFGGPVN